MGRAPASCCCLCRPGAVHPSSHPPSALHPCHDKGERKCLLQPGLGFWRQPQTSQARRSHLRLLLLSHPTRVQIHTRNTSLTHVYTLHTSCHLGPQWQAPSHSVPKMDKDNITPGNCPCAHTRRDARSTPSHADRYRHTGTNVCVHQDRSSLTVTGRHTLSQAQRMMCGHMNTPAEQHVQARSSTGRDTLTHQHSPAPSRTCTGIQRPGE